MITCLWAAMTGPLIFYWNVCRFDPHAHARVPPPTWIVMHFVWSLIHSGSAPLPPIVPWPFSKTGRSIKAHMFIGTECCDFAQFGWLLGWISAINGTLTEKFKKNSLLNNFLFWERSRDYPNWCHIIFWAFVIYSLYYLLDGFRSTLPALKEPW